MNRIDTKMPLGIHRDLAIVAMSAFIWGLGEGLFIFFLPLALQSWNTDAVQIGVVLSMIGVTMAVVQVPAGYFSDPFGTRPLNFCILNIGDCLCNRYGGGSQPAFFCRRVIGLWLYFVY